MCGEIRYLLTGAIEQKVGKAKIRAEAINASRHVIIHEIIVSVLNVDKFMALFSITSILTLLHARLKHVSRCVYVCVLLMASHHEHANFVHDNVEKLFSPAIRSPATHNLLIHYFY